MDGRLRTSVADPCGARRARPVRVSIDDPAHFGDHAGEVRDHRNALLLELALLALALYLPSALHCERQIGGGLEP